MNICGIEDEEGLLNALAYVAASPVQDGLVRRGKDRRGVRTRPEQLGTSRPVSRPNIRFFTKRTKMAAEHRLKVEVPPVLEHWDLEELKAEVERRIEAKEKAARADMKEAGRTFLGVRALKSVNRSKQATKPERHGAANVRISHVISGCSRLRIEAIIRLAAFEGPLPPSAQGFRQRPRCRVPLRDVQAGAHHETTVCSSPTVASRRDPTIC